MQTQTRLTFDQAYPLSQAALSYARSVIDIKKSTSHPDANMGMSSEDEEKRMDDMRNCADDESERIKQKLYFNYRNYHDFLATVKVSRKTGLGNCYELAFQALYYFVKYCYQQKNYKIDAQVYEIVEGDHVFLVVNQNHALTPPFDEHTVICDPWSGEVYCATEFRAKLKDHYVNRRGRNKIRPLREHQTITPYVALSTYCICIVGEFNYINQRYKMLEQMFYNTLDAINKHKTNLCTARLLLVIAEFIKTILEELEQLFTDIRYCITILKYKDGEIIHTIAERMQKTSFECDAIIENTKIQHGDHLPGIHEEIQHIKNNHLFRLFKTTDFTKRGEGKLNPPSDNHHKDEAQAVSLTH